MSGYNACWREFQVAIVEDEIDLARMYEMILARMGVPVSFVASSGTEAVEKFRVSTPKPRVVLMDNRLPLMSGTEATRAILDIKPDTCIIFLSADCAARDKAIEAGASLFISKPARVSDIIGAIGSADARSPTAIMRPYSRPDEPIGNW